MGGVQNLGEVGMVAVSWGFGGVTVCAQMLGLVFLAPKAWFLGKGPSLPSRRPSHELPGSARPMWKLHPSAQAAEAAGECDEAAEMGSRPRGKEGAPTRQGGMRPQLPRNPVWFCRQRLADKVWIGKPDPEGLGWDLLPGDAWGEGIRGGEQTNLWWGSPAPRANQDGLLRALHVTKV